MKLSDPQWEISGLTTQLDFCIVRSDLEHWAEYHEGNDEFMQDQAMHQTIPSTLLKVE